LHANGAYADLLYYPTGPSRQHNVSVSRQNAIHMLALDVGIRDGRIKPEDLLLLEAFGGGFTCSISRTDLMPSRLRSTRPRELSGCELQC